MESGAVHFAEEVLPTSDDAQDQRLRHFGGSECTRLGFFVGLDRGTGLR
jgi:hypothetical protein